MIFSFVVYHCSNHTQVWQNEAHVKEKAAILQEKLALVGLTVSSMYFVDLLTRTGKEQGTARVYC